MILFVSRLIAAIVSLLWLSAGVTGYGDGFVGDTLGCYPGVYSAEQAPWVAVPIEWVKGGLVECGDRALIEYPDGTSIEAPIMDTGCMLHYPVWDTKRPMVIDLPRIHFSASEYPTQTARIAIRTSEGEWLPVSEFPLTAWATQYCDGPLSWSWPESKPQPY